MNDSHSMLLLSENDESISFSSRNDTSSRRSWSLLLGILQFAIIGVIIFPRPSIIILCNAWMITTTTRSPSSCSIQKIPLTKRITTATTSATTTSSKALWNTQTNDSDDGDDRYIDKAKIKSYSPFQASWKSTTVGEEEKEMEDVVDDTSLQEDPPELPIEEKKFEAKATQKSNKFETPKMNINMPQMPSMPKISEMQLPDFPKMETPNMPTMNIPTMPNMNKPKMPEFPKVEAPKLPKFSVGNIKPSSSSANTTILNEKTKTTMPKIPKMPKLEAPKLSTFTWAKRTVVVERKIKPSTSNNKTILDEKTINTTTGTVEKKNYSPLQASWKTTTTTTAMMTTKTALTIHPPLHPPPTPSPTRKDQNNNHKSFASKLKMPELFPKLDRALPQLPKFPERTSSSSNEILLPKTKTNTNIENNNTDHKDYSLFQASWKTTTENTPTTADDNDNDNNSFRKLVAKITPSNRSAKNMNDIVDNKKNYSPYQASWKTTTTTTTTTATATTNNSNSNNAFPMIKLELPSLSLPDLRLLGLLPNYQNINNTNIFQIQKYNEEAQKLSLTIDQNIKQKVNAFTGRTHYEVGDITKAIIAKVANEEFELAEITFFFRILIAVGADLSGFSAVLPVGGLVGLFGWSISMGLAERFTKVVSMEVNKRVLLKEDNTSDNDADLKSADPNLGTTTTTSDASSSSLPSSSSSSISDSVNDASPVSPSTSTSTLVYTPGDLTKRAVLDYTGKSSYATGDVATATMTTTGNSSDSNSNREMNLCVLQELEECLSMEKALLEKLGRIQQQQPQQDVATTTP